MRYIHTDFQAADVFTKAFTDKIKWKNNLNLIHVVDPKTFWTPDAWWLSDPYKKTEKKKNKLQATKPGGKMGQKTRDKWFQRSQIAKHKEKMLEQMHRALSLVSAGAAAPSAADVL